MNERIRKLANIWANIRAEDERLGITYTFSEAALEKFAELLTKDIFTIIKEACIDTDFTDIDEVINDRLQDAASDVVDEYGINSQIY